MLGQYDGQAVINFLSKAVDDVRATGIESLSNNVSALLACCLVAVGRADEAGRLWRDYGLPCGVGELLDIARQSWRTMETLSCARVRLLAEQGECGVGEELAGSLCTVASEHGLTRTLLRGLALSMVVAYRAGQPDRAQERLVRCSGLRFPTAWRLRCRTPRGRCPGGSGWRRRRRLRVVLLPPRSAPPVACFARLGAPRRG